MEENSLKLVPWTIPEQSNKKRRFEEGLQTLSLSPMADSHLNITSQFRPNGLYGAVGRKYVSLNVI